MFFALILLLNGEPVAVGQYPAEECAALAEMYPGSFCEFVGTL